MVLCEGSEVTGVGDLSGWQQNESKERDWETLTHINQDRERRGGYKYTTQITHTDNEIRSQHHFFFNFFKHNRTPSGKKMVTGVQVVTAS